MKFHRPLRTERQPRGHGAGNGLRATGRRSPAGRCRVTVPRDGPRPGRCRVMVPRDGPLPSDAAHLAGGGLAGAEGRTGAYDP